MTERPTWPEMLSLFEELRFQVAAVVMVLGFGAAAVAFTRLSPEATSITPAPVARDLSGGAVAGPEPASTAAIADVVSTTTSEATRAATTAPELAARVARTPVAQTKLTPAAGDRARLVAPAPVRLTCNEDQAPLGVLLGGAEVDVIEVGTAACAGWLLVQSSNGLTWLHPSMLEGIEGSAGVTAPTRP